MWADGRRSRLTKPLDERDHGGLAKWPPAPDRSPAGKLDEQPFLPAFAVPILLISEAQERRNQGVSFTDAHQIIGILTGKYPRQCWSSAQQKGSAAESLAGEAERRQLIQASSKPRSLRWPDFDEDWLRQWYRLRGTAPVRCRQVLIQHPLMSAVLINQIEPSLTFEEQEFSLHLPNEAQRRQARRHNPAVVIRDVDFLRDNRQCQSV